MFDVKQALRELVAKQGSDLHVKVDSRPLYRIHGELAVDEGADTLTAEDTEGALHVLLQRPRQAGGVHARARGRLLL